MTPPFPVALQCMPVKSRCIFNIFPYILDHFKLPLSRILELRNRTALKKRLKSSNRLIRAFQFLQLRPHIHKQSIWTGTSENLNARTVFDSSDHYLIPAV